MDDSRDVIWGKEPAYCGFDNRYLFSCEHPPEQELEPGNQLDELVVLVLLRY